MLGLKATDKEDGNLTNKISIVENTVNTNKAGNYSVKAKVTDKRGASVTKTFKVTVNKKIIVPKSTNEAPVIEGKDIIIQQNRQFDISLLNLKATDKEDGDLTDKIKIIENTDIIDQKGTNIIKVKVTDNEGLSTTKIFKITRILEGNPEIQGKNVTIKQGEEFNISMLKLEAFDNEDYNITDKIKIIKNTVNVNKPGYYSITAIVTDKENISEIASFGVNVINEAPVIEGKNVSIVQGKPFDISMLGLKATDREDGDLTDKIKVIENTVDTNKEGKYIVRAKVIDSEGNKTIKKFYISVGPNQAPIIEGKDVSILLGDKFDISMLNLKAIDREDGDLTNKIEIIKNTVNLNIVGEYIVKAKVTDSEGFSTTKTLKVKVENNSEVNEYPSFEWSDLDIIEGDKFDISMLNLKAIDGEDGDLTNKIEIIENTVNVNEPGEYTVKVKVTDSKGASSTTECRVNVYPNTAPVISGVLDQEIIQGQKFDISMLELSAEDREDGDLTDKIEIIENTVNVNEPGEYTVKAKVTDNKGASTTETFRVTVLPNEAPVIQGKDITIIQGQHFDTQGQYFDTYDPLILGLKATDKEDGDLTDKIEIIENTVNVNEPGVYTIKAKVTDNEGLSTTKIINVTVVKNEAPIIEGKNITITKVELDKFDISMLDLKATDKEDGDLTDRIIANIVPDYPESGNYVVNARVTDNEGLLTTKTFKITVIPNKNSTTEGKDSTKIED